VSARDGAVSIKDKYGVPVAPEAHVHEGCRRKHTPLANGRWCHCTSPKSFECLKCARDRHIRKGLN
jgi:hypothetical protein